jgi:hypothetical protein
LDDQIEKKIMGVALAGIMEKRSIYRIYVEKTEEKKPLERPRHRWENNNNKMDIQELGF